MQKEDLTERAGVMLDQADKIGCKQFVTPKVRQTHRHGKAASSSKHFH